MNMIFHVGLETAYLRCLCRLTPSEIQDSASVIQARAPSTKGGNPVANHHKWRIGHESVETCQTKELSNFALNFLIFSF
jgi:hypothetical protein